MPRRHISRFFLRLLLLLLFCGLLLPPAHALRFQVGKEQLTLDFSLTSAFEWHTVNRTYNPTILNAAVERAAHGKDYFDLQNKLDFNISYERWRLGGRLDTFNFFSDRFPCHPSFPKIRDKYPSLVFYPDCKQGYIPEKLYLKVNLNNLDITLGDFYITLGRGMAMLFRKVDEFGQDTTLRGARVDVKSKGFQATVAGGFANDSNFDPIQETFLVDARDFFFATSASQRFMRSMRIGGHYVFRYNPAPPKDPNVIVQLPAEHYHIIGGLFEAKNLFGKVDFYLEGNLMERSHVRAVLPDDPGMGVALYTNINVYLFPFTLQIEGQWYDNYSLSLERETMYRSGKAGTTEVPFVAPPPLLYVNPPSMEDIQNDTQGDNSNTRGVRVRLDYTLPSRDTLFWVNYLFRYGFIPASPLTLHHVYAGGEHRADWFSIVAYAGFRELTGDEYWRRIHAEMDLNFRIGRRHSLKLFSTYWYNLRGDKSQKYTFHILDVQLGYSFSKIGSIALLFSYSDENQNEAVPRIYPAVEVKVLLPKLGSLKLFYGRGRGGLRCVSGICRVFPAFEGLRAELSVRF
jgi:hypothetical protein